MKIEFQIGWGKVIVRAGNMRVLLRASSGNGPCKNNPSVECQKQKFHGPIPVGEYYIRPSELSDPNVVMDVARSLRSMADWGDFRARLYPRLKTETYGRDNFFIHGGMFSGSAGCIDVGGGMFGSNRTDQLVNMIREQNSMIKVEVTP